ncbi:MAG TPA: hypothetical protein VLT59_06145 [Steroidobacteraceae bacterium]|nr:hypothetical protein [Steroidobacteraceae bacterium]
MSNAIEPTAAARLPELAVLHVTGTDARTFLQGQLSADLNEVTAVQGRLACLNSAQGRVQAIAWLVEREDDLLLTVPAQLVPRFLERLRRYVLRAKVTIDDARERWACFAASSASLEIVAPGARTPDRAAGSTFQRDTAIVLRVATDEDRYLVIGPAQEPDSSVGPDGSAVWRLAEIRAGHPQVYEATWEAFVAQMLNLDLLGAISFTKGCYTGQEIIARAHYRGAVKRRMVRLATAGAVPAPGTRILAGDAHAGEVVDAAATATGVELLGVVALARMAEPLVLEDGPALERLPLPYGSSD